MSLDLTALGRTKVVDASENEIELGSLWRNHPGSTILVWLRHYG